MRKPIKMHTIHFCLDIFEKKTKNKAHSSLTDTYRVPSIPNKSAKSWFYAVFLY